MVNETWLAELDLASDMASLSYAVERHKVDVPELVLPADVFVALRGLRFHYLDWGNHSRRPILFLHGGGLTAHTYDLICLALRRDYQCLSLDQRGHGDSAWSPSLEYDATEHGADIDALLTYLGLSDVVIVGMSMGGLNAIQYAGDHPERLAGLVIIDVGPEIQPSGSERIQRFMAELAEAETVDDIVARAIAFNPDRDPRLLRRSLLYNVRRTPEGKWTWKWDPRPRRTLDPSQAAERRYRLWSQVDRITCPTLVVRGRESDVFSRENAAELVRRLPQGHSAEVEAAGHSVQGDNPAGLLRKIRQFLSKISFA